MSNPIIDRIYELTCENNELRSELEKAQSEIERLRADLVSVYAQLSDGDGTPTFEMSPEEWAEFKKEHGIEEYRIEFTHNKKSGD